MNYPNVNSLVFHFCLFLLLKYSNCAPNESEPNSTYTLLDADEEPPAASSSTQSTYFSSFLTGMRDAATRVQSAAFRARVRMSMYCKNVYDPKDVEELLSIGTLLPNWWFDEHQTNRYIDNPLCSAYPNASPSVSTRISDHEFFRTYYIRILVKRGTKGRRLNKYEHLNLEPTWTRMLECECVKSRTLFGGNTQLPRDDICVNGRIINLSRGVGGDTSFFVHAPNSSGTYKVLAHICFKIRVQPAY